MQMSLNQPEDMRAGELILPSADTGIGWFSQNSAGEIALEVLIGES